MSLMPNPWTDVGVPADVPPPVPAPEAAAAEPESAIDAAPSDWEPDEAFMRELEARLRKLNEQAEPAPLFLRAPSEPFLRTLLELGGALDPARA